MLLHGLRLRRAAEQLQRCPRPIFGFYPSSTSIGKVVDTLLSRKRTQEEGVGLVVTPNIQHIAQLRRNPAFRDAYNYAAIILSDGFPVYYYALARGHTLNRITGCDLLEQLLAQPEFIRHQRLFLVVDDERTARVVNEWADRSRLRSQVMTHVPPLNFEKDAISLAKLANEICLHSTTLLVMAVGAPHSEIFVHQYRSSLPPCWAICIGQGVKTRFGLVQRAPGFVRRVNMEWLWRIVQEPRRLLPRYADAAIAFVAGVFLDLWQPALSDQPPTVSLTRQ
jgi:N-acetylglucosaminyldiphosphoundecaprenol N-acetyl-beta-D-mannosaminyltransferase